MNTKVLTTLEYTKIIDLLTEKADSEPGKKLCRDLVPSTDLSTIRTAQRETKDALARLFRIGSTSFGSNRDLRIFDPFSGNRQFSVYVRIVEAGILFG